MESNDINPGRTVSLQFLWCGDTFFEYLSPFDFLYCDIKSQHCYTGIPRPFPNKSICGLFSFLLPSNLFYITVYN